MTVMYFDLSCWDVLWQGNKTARALFYTHRRLEMKEKISVVFFLGRELERNINFYGLREDEVRFLIEYHFIAKDLGWVSYKIT